METLISVIIPVYNVQTYLPECLESICSQSYKNLEIIIVNDGSTDQSLEICQSYARRDSRIRLRSQTRGGVSAARNHGLQIARGEWITFIDADDWVEKDYLTTLSSYMEDSVDIVCCNQKISNDVAFIRAVRQEQMAQVFSEYGYTWGKLIRRSCIHSLFTEGIQYAEDFLFYVGMIRYLRAMTIVNYSGYHYRIRVGSLSVKSPDELPTINEFESKFTFVQSESLLRKQARNLNPSSNDIIQAHCCYIYALLLLLHVKIGHPSTQKRKILQDFIRKNMPALFRITLRKEKNFKRFGFEVLLSLFPELAGRIAGRLLQ